MPWYRKAGKNLSALTHAEFKEGMVKGHFSRREHRGFLVLLYYSGVRKAEGLRARRQQFQISNDVLYFDVGKRLKHGIVTPPLVIPLSADYANEIVYCVEKTKGNKRVWPYSLKTGYNIVARVFFYPHHLRLSRITNFFSEQPNRPPYSIAEVRSWSGLTLSSLEFYVGTVDIDKMGRGLND